jgi:hypothetical protein
MSMQKVMGAVHWVNDPAAIVISSKVARFFTDDIKLWVAVIKMFDYRALGHQIDFSHQLVTVFGAYFIVYFNAIQLSDVMRNDFACFKRSCGGDV